MLNENDHIREMLKKIRILTEAPVRMKEDKSDVVSFREVGIDGEEEDKEQETKNGEEVSFDGLRTVGFINSQEELEDDLKNQIVTGIGEFIKNSGLLMDSVDILIEDNKIVMTSETLKNPGLESLKAISFNTDEESPKLEFVSGAIELNKDVIELLQMVYSSFNDPQIGRKKLVTIARGQI